jgi:hypothetical protein
LLGGVGAGAGPALLTAGSLGLLAASWRVWGRQPATHTLTLALGALAWTAGNMMWLAGLDVPAVVPLWIAFLVLTIAGERLELSRFMPPSPAARRAFSVIVTVLLIAMLPAVPGAAKQLFPAGLLAIALWLMSQDIARRTVRERGLTRFIAVCLLSGYAWLAIGALALLGAGGIAPGTAGYEAGLHAILLGFLFAMVFGHAPIIFPAILGLRLTYHPLSYLPLVVLHASVAVRLAGTLAGDLPLRSAGGMLNAASLALFVAGVLLSILRGRSQ